MKSAFSSFSTSSVTALLRFGANILCFYYTSLHSELTLRRCCMIFLSIPSISSRFQAKTSWFALKKEIIFSFSEVGIVVPIFNTFVESPRSISTSCGISNGLRMGSGSLITHVRFSLDAKVDWQHSLARTWSLLISPTLWAIGNFTFK